MESLQSQLYTAQSELAQQCTRYNQIKYLQEQTDRALADSQGNVFNWKWKSQMAKSMSNNWKKNEQD
jgi:hypothetical protein